MMDTMQNKNSASKIFNNFVCACPCKAALELEAMPLSEALSLLLLLPAQSIILCLQNMKSNKAAALLRRLPLKQACYVLSRIKAIKAAEIFSFLPSPYQARLKNVLDKKLFKTLSEVLKYPKDS